MNQHLIQSQKMLLTVASQQDWERVQAEIGHFCKTRLPDVLNTIFDEFALNQTIRIDQLNIDLGNLSLDRLAQDIEEQIIIQVYGYLKDHHQHKANSGFIWDKELGSFLSGLKVNPIAPLKGKPISFEYEAEASSYESLAFYCQTGLKPWWLATEAVFKPAAILVKLFHTDRQLCYQFIKLLKQNTVSYKRLIQLINSRLFFYEFHQFKTDILILKYLEPAIKGNLYKLILEYWFVDLEAENSLADIEDFGLWLFSLVQKDRSFKSACLALIKQRMIAVQVKKEKPALLQRFNKLLTAIEKQKELPELKRTVKAEEKKTDERKQYDVPKEDSVLIENAGLILLYPYFKNLFNGLELLDGKIFKDESSSHKAIVYLHYLVFNEIPEDESQLFFNKILCGVDPETVIELDEITFTEAELAECDELKLTVIKHWPKLATTTVKGFTNTFLRRTGSLIFREGNYHLYVERKGFDVLLDTIPWPLSIIRLPWNNYLINLNW